MVDEVTKRSGEKEDFESEKIVKSCINAGVPKDVAEKIAEEVEKSVEDEVSTERINDLIMEMLKELDEEWAENWKEQQSATLGEPPGRAIAGIIVVLFCFLLSYYFHSIGMEIRGISLTITQWAGLVGFGGLGFITGFSTAITYRSRYFLGLAGVLLFFPIAMLISLMTEGAFLNVNVFVQMVETASWILFLIAAGVGFLLAAIKA